MNIKQLTLAIGLLCVSFIVNADALQEGYAAYKAKDYKTALAKLKPLAAQGNAKAQYDVGFMYATGSGIAKDENQAISWLRKSAELGYPEAQFTLGDLYQKGLMGLAKDEKQSVAWYRKAAEQGHALAQNNLGTIYQVGRILPKDYKLAVAWYRKSAEQGNAVAQNNLGVMYAEGGGVPKDDIQAVTWFRQAAEQGYAGAQYYLGYMYENGRGVPKDDIQAQVWYRKAAEQGNADAKSVLSRSPNQTAEKSQHGGAFGVQLGSKFDKSNTVSNYVLIWSSGGESLERVDRTRAKTSDDKFNHKYYELKPPEPSIPFTNYYVGLTPRTSVIYTIVAVLDNDKDCWAHHENLSHVLRKKYGEKNEFSPSGYTTIEYNVNKLKVRLTCKSDQLRIIYTDSRLKKQRDKELDELEKMELDRKTKNIDSSKF